LYPKNTIRVLYVRRHSIQKNSEKCDTLQSHEAKHTLLLVGEGVNTQLVAFKLM